MYLFISQSCLLESSNVNLPSSAYFGERIARGLMFIFVWEQITGITYSVLAGV